MQITVYSKPRCVQCEATVKELNRLEAHFDYIDVTQDEVAYDQLVAEGHKQMPVVKTSTEHTGSTWSGFDIAKIREAVAAQKAA